MKKKSAVVLSMVLGLSLITGCGAKEETTTQAEVTTEAVTEAEVEEEEVTEATEVDASSSDAEWAYGEYTYTGDDMIESAITFFICDELAKGYEAANVGLPVVIEVSRDESDPDDIKVWGEFEYFTYNLVGDTLETQAGGSYPGCMHIKTTDAGIGYVVDHFDPVADGSDFDASAKEIFGDKYDAFMEVYSNDDLKNEKRKDFIEEYVFSHSVPATKYQDYGWDPVELNVSAGDPADDDVVYMGGLYASDEVCDVNIALFKSAGHPVAVITEGENIYYGEFEEEESTLKDGSYVTMITVEGKTYGYRFDQDDNGEFGSTGVIVDQDGNEHFAKWLDESVAIEMKAETE